MEGKKRIKKFEQIEEIIDHETGEIIQTRKKTAIEIDKEPEYIKMYINDVARLNDIPKGMSPILIKLISNMGYNNVIAAYKPIKLMVCRDLGISLNYLNKAIQSFHDKGLFIRVARGVYMADPELFARGKWDDIKSLRLVIEYQDNGTKKLKSTLPEEVQLRLGL